MLAQSIPNPAVHEPTPARAGASLGPRHRLLSLGGCVTHDISKRAEGFAIKHIDHFWRRPTIPLMSKAPHQTPFLDSDFPPDLTRYWHDDFRKAHADEIALSTANIIVFDITRDINAGYIELDDYIYVIDPLSVRGIMWDGGNVDANKIDATLGRNLKRFTFRDSSWAELWASHFDIFADAVKRFEYVILNKLYFTSTMASMQDMQHGSASEIGYINSSLDEMYDYVAKYHSFIHINTIPRRLFLTGTQVSWGGPTYTHVIPEATALFADNIRSIVLGKSTQSVLTDCALERAKKSEDIFRDLQTSLAERESLATQLHALIEERDALLARASDAENERDNLAIQRDGLTAQLHALVEERDALLARASDAENERDDLATQRNGLTAQLHALVEERDALLARASDAENEYENLVPERNDLIVQLHAAE